MDEFIWYVVFVNLLGTCSIFVSNAILGYNLHVVSSQMSGGHIAKENKK